MLGKLVRMTLYGCGWCAGIIATLRELALARRRPPPAKFGDGTRDLVDEASWESFPCSDPPAY